MQFGLSAAAKFWVALVLGILVAGLVVLEAALADGSISAVEVVQIVAAVVAVPASVWAVPNRSVP